MGICKLVAKTLFFAYFGLLAWNALTNNIQATTAFTTEYGVFFKTLKDRIGHDLLNHIEPKVVLKYATDIVKYGHYTMLAAAAGTLIHSGFAWVVGLTYFIFQAIHLNFAGLGLNTKLTDWEAVAKVFALTTVCFLWSCCSKKCNKYTKAAYEAHDRVQADRKKNEDEPAGKHQRKRGH